MKFISSLLLLFGTVLGALAAAEGQKPWIAVPTAGLSEAEPPAVLFEGTGIFPGGAVVTAEVEENLAGAGFEDVKILRHPVTSETIAFSDPAELLGRVLDEDLFAPGDDPEAEDAKPLVAAGRFVDEDALEDLAATERTEVTVRVPAEWDWSRWGASKWFLLAIGMMLVAIVLRKAAGDDVEATAKADGTSVGGFDELKSLLGEVQQKSAALVPRIESLDPGAAAAELEGVGEGVRVGVEAPRDRLVDRIEAQRQVGGQHHRRVPLRRRH